MLEIAKYDEMDNVALVERLCHAADDGAMYYLIFVRMHDTLRKEMGRYDMVDEDVCYDTLMDFFFYFSCRTLQESKADREGRYG